MIRNYRKKKKIDLGESVNLIPMINIIFLLLIFFLLTGIIQKKDDQNIVIPESSKGVRKESLVVQKILSINEIGNIIFNNEPIGVSDLLKLNLLKDDKILINIDKNIKIKKLNQVLVNLKKIGLEKIHLNVRNRDDKN
ncbi:MAG: biopolymer transporter ExbD [Alphaproteobacteria bacterium]